MSKYCKHCGEEINKKDLHCPKCGKKLKKVKITLGRIILFSSLIIILIIFLLVVKYQPNIKLPSDISPHPDYETFPNPEIADCVSECVYSGCVEEEGLPVFIICNDFDGDGCFEKEDWVLCATPEAYCMDRRWCITSGKTLLEFNSEAYGASNFKEGDVYYTTIWELNKNYRCEVSNVWEDTYSIAACFVE